MFEANMNLLADISTLDVERYHFGQNLTTNCLRYWSSGLTEREIPSRSSRPDVFCEKCVLRNFAKFTGKHLYQSLFFNKVAGAACNFIKNEALVQVFSCEFCEISKTPFFTEHLWWLLLTPAILYNYGYVHQLMHGEPSLQLLDLQVE